MRILHVIQRYWPCIGGSERYLQAIAERQAAEGHQVTVYTTDAWDLEHFWAPGKQVIHPTTEMHNGVTIVRFPVRRLPFSRLSFPAWRRMMSTVSDLPLDTSSILAALCALTPWVPQLAATLARTSDDYDIIHGMNICFESLLYPAYRFARRVGVAFLITPLIHLGETSDKKVRRYYTMRHQLRLIEESEAVLAQTAMEAKYLVEGRIEPDKIVEAPAAVEPRELLGGDGQRFRRKYNLEGPIVAYMGALAYDKGAHHSVQAISNLIHEGSSVKLVMIGPVMEQFTSFFSHVPEEVKKHCRVLGFVPEEDKKDLLDAMNLLVLPSRTDSLGLVFLEAWLYKKPVIGANAGGIPEVVDEERDGFLVPFGDTASLAHRIALLLTDPHKAAELGHNGHQKVMDRFTWDKIYPKVREVYERLWLGRRKRATLREAR